MTGCNFLSILDLMLSCLKNLYLYLIIIFSESLVSYVKVLKDAYSLLGKEKNTGMSSPPSPYSPPFLLLLLLFVYLKLSLKQFKIWKWLLWLSKSNACNSVTQNFVDLYKLYYTLIYIYIYIYIYILYIYIYIISIYIIYIISIYIYIYIYIIYYIYYIYIYIYISALISDHLKNIKKSDSILACRQLQARNQVFI